MMSFRIVGQRGLFESRPSFHLSDNFLNIIEVTFIKADLYILLTEHSGEHLVLLFRQQHSSFLDRKLIIHPQADAISSLVVVLICLI
jgi:hypothetical protein